MVDKPGRGRKSRLSPDTEDQGTIIQLITTKSPEDFGYNTSTWNGPLLIDWIQNHLNISFKKAQIYNIINDLGFTYQKSKGFYPEADPEKQEEFKVELKKTPRISD